MTRLETLHTRMRACRLCDTAGHPIVRGAVFSCGSNPQVMIIGQAPGVTEVEAKRPFNASSGRRLFQWLGAAGWNEDEFRQRHAMTSVTKCFPGKPASGRGDRVPTKAEQTLCRPFLEQEIALINPRVIVPVGGLAIKLFFPSGMKLTEIIGNAWFFEQSVVEANDGVVFDVALARRATHFQAQDGRYIIPLPHPSGASLWPNKPENKALIDRATDLLGVLRQSMHL